MVLNILKRGMQNVRALKVAMLADFHKRIETEVNQRALSPGTHRNPFDSLYFTTVLYVSFIFGLIRVENSFLPRIFDFFMVFGFGPYFIYYNSLIKFYAARHEMDVYHADTADQK